MDKVDKFKNVNKEIMEDSIPAIKIMEEINKTILKIEGTNDEKLKKKYIEDFYKKADSWQIIVAKPKDSYVWMQIPIMYQEKERKLSLLERIKILFTQGVWIKPQVVEKYAEMLSNLKFPMEIELEPMDFIFAKSSEIDKFYYSAIYLTGKMMETMLMSNSSSLAIYDKPNGIIAMNNVNYWLGEMTRQGLADTSHLQSTLRTATIAELIRDSTVEMIGVKDYIKNKEPIASA